MMWNLARVSCVPSTIDITGKLTICSSRIYDHAKGFFVYGCDDQELVSRVINTLNAAVGATEEEIEDGAETFYDVEATEKEAEIFREMLRQGKMSVLQRDGKNVAYCLTDGKATTFMLQVLNTRTLSDATPG